MKKAERRARAKLLLEKLQALRDEWELESKSDALSIGTTHDLSRRERLKTIEAEAALLRLMQSEDRLVTQLAVGLLSFVGGSAVTLLLKAFLG